MDMNDRIERLRSPIIGVQCAVALCLEAADEIERLTAHCAGLENADKVRRERIKQLESVLNQAYGEQANHGYNSRETFELMGAAIKGDKQ